MLENRKKRINLSIRNISISQTLISLTFYLCIVKIIVRLGPKNGWLNLPERPVKEGNEHDMLVTLLLFKIFITAFYGYTRSVTIQAGKGSRNI